MFITCPSWRRLFIEESHPLRNAQSSNEPKCKLKNEIERESGHESRVVRASNGHLALPSTLKKIDITHISTPNGKKSVAEAVILRKAACPIASRMCRHVSNMNILMDNCMPKTFSTIHDMVAEKTVRCVVRCFDTMVYGKYTVCFTPFTLAKLENYCCGSRSSTESVDEAELGPATPCFLEAWEMTS